MNLEGCEHSIMSILQIIIKVVNNITGLNN